MVFTGGALAGAWGTVVPGSVAAASGVGAANLGAASVLATAGAASPGLAALGTSLLSTGAQTGLGFAMQKIEGTPKIPEPQLFGQNPGLDVEGAGMARNLPLGYQPTQLQYGIDGISAQAV